MWKGRTDLELAGGVGPGTLEQYRIGKESANTHK